MPETEPQLEPGRNLLRMSITVTPEEARAMNEIANRDWDGNRSLMLRALFRDYKKKSEKSRK